LTPEEIILHFQEGKCEEEWNDFQPANELSPDRSAKLWNTINKNTTSPTVHYSYTRWMAVAASMLLVVGLSWLFIVKKQNPVTISAATTKHISNHTAKKMTLTLSDSSTVELSPGSTLSYPENFNADKRVAIVNGEANFNIAKDPAKPFSVSINSVLITVLGTQFTVNADEANNGTKVVLSEGRVMVKANKREYYLSPGDILICKKVNDTLAARILQLEKNDEGYVFNNYPLDVVFDQLQIIYHTKIIYNKAALGNRSFIGKIDKKDSLTHMLKSIALLNNFGLQKQGDSFIISTPY
jgi:transmembrane sensor